MNGNKVPSGPFIPILMVDESGRSIADFIGYGLEEEGIPFQTILDDKQEMTGYILAHQSALGVALTVLPHEIQIFSRLRKDDSPLLVFQIPNDASPDPLAKAAGKNAARIVKGKPLVETDFVGQA